MFFPKGRIITIVGHYGSGKSELAINIALLLAAEKKTGEGLDESAPFCLDKSVYLADLDVVNPYFRSREAADYLKERGIKVIASAEDFPNVDLPYMPETLAAIFHDRDSLAVIDAGGDPAGAKVLARYSDNLRKNDAEVAFILNANRPSTRAAEEAIRYIRNIEGACNLRITGIINNTHLMRATEVEDIYAGANLANLVSEETGIPIIAHAVDRRLINSVSEIPKELILPIDIYLKKPWE